MRVRVCFRTFVCVCGGGGGVRAFVRACIRTCVHRKRTWFLLKGKFTKNDHIIYRSVWGAELNGEGPRCMR